jgi:hypothetical protein
MLNQKIASSFLSRACPVLRYGGGAEEDLFIIDFKGLQEVGKGGGGFF